MKWITGNFERNQVSHIGTESVWITDSHGLNFPVLPQLKTMLRKGMAMVMAKTAMSSVGDLSLIFQFLRDSFNAANAVILGQLVEQCLTGHGLETCLSLRCQQNSIYLGSNKTLTPLEVELLNRAQTRGSLVEHGKRLITQRGSTVLLVKNFPIENPDLWDSHPYYDRENGPL